MHAGNFYMKVESTGKDNLQKAMEIAFSGHHNEAKYFSISTENGMVFYWLEDKDHDTKPCYPFGTWTVKQCFEHAWEWLKDHAEYPEQPKTDGSVDTGWIVETIGNFYSIVSIKPSWAVYSK